jgi:hypothetical protein
MITVFEKVKGSPLCPTAGPRCMDGARSRHRYNEATNPPNDLLQNYTRRRYPQALTAQRPP